MPLKEMFSAMRKEGYVTAPLERWLFEQSNQPNDRAVNVNAPSQAGKCIRANYYARMGYEGDGTIDPRTQRIFDNGTHVHLRLQEYLIKMGLLLMDEVPVLNIPYNIQGHTDGLLSLPEKEIAILEIKSINDNQFQQLKDAKEEHKMQGLIYAFCIEDRRKFLHNTFHDEADFNSSYNERYRFFTSRYQHLKSGAKYTREQKIHNEVMLNMLTDNILFYTDKPVTKVIFLYEDKNNQELKEFCVERGIANDALLADLLKKYQQLNHFCEDETVPPREGRNKSDSLCRWCGYKSECWVV